MAPEKREVDVRHERKIASFTPHKCLERQGPHAWSMGEEIEAFRGSESGLRLSSLEVESQHPSRSVLTVSVTGCLEALGVGMSLME